MVLHHHREPAPLSAESPAAGLVPRHKIESMFRAAIDATRRRGASAADLLDALGVVAGEVAAASGLDTGEALRRVLRQATRADHAGRAPATPQDEDLRERRAEAGHARRPYRKPRT